MEPSILRQIAGGDPSAVRRCIDIYGALVWGLARRLSSTPSDAEDATQEIFLHVWQYAARFDETRGSEVTFIAMIARRRLIDRLRKRSAVPAMDHSTETLESMPCHRAGPSDCTELDSEAGRAMEALAEMRLELRQVLELGILQGMTHAAIAKRLNMPLGTVKSNCRRGLMQLRKCLEGPIVQAPRIKAAKGVKNPVIAPVATSARALREQFSDIIGWNSPTEVFEKPELS